MTMACVLYFHFVRGLKRRSFYGQIPEWPKGTDCKSAATCFGGSNPPLPILIICELHEKRDTCVRYLFLRVFFTEPVLRILFPQGKDGAMSY